MSWIMEAISSFRGSPLVACILGKGVFFFFLDELSILRRSKDEKKLQPKIQFSFLNVTQSPKIAS